MCNGGGSAHRVATDKPLCKGASGTMELHGVSLEALRQIDFHLITTGYLDMLPQLHRSWQYCDNAT